MKRVSFPAVAVLVFLIASEYCFGQEIHFKSIAEMQKMTADDIVEDISEGKVFDFVAAFDVGTIK